MVQWQVQGSLAYHLSDWVAMMEGNAPDFAIDCLIRCPISDWYFPPDVPLAAYSRVTGRKEITYLPSSKSFRALMMSWSSMPLCLSKAMLSSSVFAVEISATESLMTKGKCPTLRHLRLKFEAKKVCQIARRNARLLRLV